MSGDIAGPQFAISRKGKNADAMGLSQDAQHSLCTPNSNHAHVPSSF
jgi:hypothetical protein